MVARSGLPPIVTGGIGGYSPWRTRFQNPRGSTILMGERSAMSMRSRSPVTKTSTWPLMAEARTHWSSRSRSGGPPGRRSRDYLVLPQKIDDLLHRARRQTDSPSQDASQLSQHHLARRERVLGEHHAQHVRAHPARREGADQDVRVQEHSRDTSRAISSSVRYPRASANGSVRRRSRSNLSRLSCRRRASRTSSLLVRPVCRHSWSSLRSRSRSSRIVTADLMSYPMYYE